MYLQAGLERSGLRGLLVLALSEFSAFGSFASLSAFCTLRDSRLLIGKWLTMSLVIYFFIKHNLCWVYKNGNSGI